MSYAYYELESGESEAYFLLRMSGVKKGKTKGKQKKFTTKLEPTTLKLNDEEFERINGRITKSTHQTLRLIQIMKKGSK